MTPTAPIQEPDADSGELTSVGAGIDWADPNSPLAPYYLRNADIFAVFALGLVLFLTNIVPLWHTDIWCHLKFAEYSVRNGGFPSSDPFTTFSDPSQKVAVLQPLSQMAYLLVFRLGEGVTAGGPERQLAGGVEALRLFFSLLVVARFALLFAAFRIRSGSVVVASGGVLLVAALGLDLMLVIRPQVFGELCFAALLFLSSRPILSRRAVVLVPVVMLLWVNCHGSFVIGVGFLGLLLLGTVADAWQRGHRPLTTPTVRAAGAAFVLGVLATLVNYHGIGIYSEIARFAQHPLIQNVQEWQPLAMMPQRWSTLAFLATLLIAGLSLRYGSRTPTASTILLLGAFALLPCLQHRTMVWWVMVLPWLMMPFWRPSREADSEANFRKTLLAVAVAVLFLVWSPSSRWLLGAGAAPVQHLVSEPTPIAVVATLRGWNDRDLHLPKLAEVVAEYPDGRLTGGIYCTDTQGEFLTWGLAPELPVVLNTHLHLFDTTHWSDCVSVAQASVDWWYVLDHWDINLVVVEATAFAGLCQKLTDDPDWVVALDETKDSPKTLPNGRLFVAIRKPLK